MRFASLASVPADALDDVDCSRLPAGAGIIAAAMLSFVCMAAGMILI